MNLILLCKNHHKQVDDQPNLFTVERLHAMKRQHEDAVHRALSALDVAVQRDRELYATYVDQWSDLAALSEWSSWTSRLMTSDQPQMTVARSKSLDQLRRWLFGRIWPGRYPELESALENFRRVLEDLQKVFEEHAELRGDFRTTERFYRIRGWNRARCDELLAEYEFHVWLVEDLTLELTRAANYVCDQVRSTIDRSFRLDEGLLLTESGPHSPGLEFNIHRPEYRGPERVASPYPGLEIFKTVRFERDGFFGERPKHRSRGPRARRGRRTAAARAENDDAV